MHHNQLHDEEVCPWCKGEQIPEDLESLQQREVLKLEGGMKNLLKELKRANFI